MLEGYIERREGNWDRSTQRLQRALELDPRNPVFLKQLAHTFKMLRQYGRMRKTLDRALVILPNDPALQVQQAAIELEAAADPRPVRQAIERALSKDPQAGPVIADQWLALALCEGDADAATHVLSIMNPTGANDESVPFPKEWIAGVIARMRDDSGAARAAFSDARMALARIPDEQPDFAQGLSALGMIDAALGDKESALREGRRAVELLPTSKDAIVGPLLLQNLAVIYAWTGEKDKALEALRQVASLPSYLSYGQLLLHPSWAPLRGEEGFKKIVASLAPKTR